MKMQVCLRSSWIDDLRRSPGLAEVVIGSRVMNRREFVSASLGASILARAAGSFGAQARYDLIIKGGRLIDPSVRLDAVRDVAISGGRIVAVESNISANAAQTIDARDKIVAPGLIDIHTHCARDGRGPGMVLKDGVTGWIDAGSQGADRIAETVAVAKTSPQLGRCLINIGRAGILADGDTMDLTRADTGAMRDAIAKNREFIVGVKARLSREVVGANDVEVLRRSQEVAAYFNLPLMIHMGQTTSPLSVLMNMLKEGDIVTHMFAPPPNAIVDDSGHILPEVLAARRRGVWFDVGNGVTGHMRWDTIESIMKAGFWPDTFSTDWNVNSPTSGVINFPNCMSKLLGFGMTVPQAIACATTNAAHTFPVFRDRGTLNVGAIADVALLELREGNFEFLDNYNNKRAGTQRLFPAGTILNGKQIL
jgi:dihydroorotase